MKPISKKDTQILKRLPVGKWFFAGAYTIHGSTLARLVRLDVLERRLAPFNMFGATWQYFRPR